ncbi:TIGR03986 family type III CRISPR-associated RAMP protein [Maridesulfovibrio zosterae]|uniref:TIGR03986 family type III CRISPR-associated RAMP protein n=1 Tax=Maridesulfovibrio zosterae TaxID=82171 RepID=UPI0003FB52DD|nr:TIGR03986 family CRISPR-associated RAMP protein [Maridesulfovibrio zosterae]
MKYISMVIHFEAGDDIDTLLSSLKKSVESEGIKFRTVIQRESLRCYVNFESDQDRERMKQLFPISVSKVGNYYTQYSRLNGFFSNDRFAGSNRKAGSHKKSNESNRKTEPHKKSKVQRRTGDAFIYPYHFVGLDHDCKSYTANEKDNIFVDKFSGSSGRVLFEIEVESPMIIGACQQERDGKPSFVYQFEIDGKPAIPASSLKGMLSSVMEAASNSSLRVLGDLNYSSRKNYREGLPYYGVLVDKNGELYVRKFRSGVGEKKRIWSKLIDNWKLNDHSATGEIFRVIDKQFDHNRERQDFLEEVQEYFPADGHEYGVFRILGKDSKNGKEIRLMPSKAADGFFLSFEIHGREFRDYPLGEAKSHFEGLCDYFMQQNFNEQNERLRHPYLPRGRKSDFINGYPTVRLKEGDIVAFDVEYGEVSEVSFSSIWRMAYYNIDESQECLSTNKLFGKINPKFLPPSSSGEYIEKVELTPASALLGFVDGNSDGKGALAGRLKFEHALTASEEALDKTTFLPLLMAPKPPCPGFYYTTGENLKELRKPMGRKFYRHSERTKDIPKADAVPNNKEVTPVKKGTVFQTYIDFENCSDAEIGMLLYALRPDEKFRHQLGMGKPYGYGRVKISCKGLMFIDREKRYAPGSLRNCFSQLYGDCYLDQDIETIMADHAHWEWLKRPMRGVNSLSLSEAIKKYVSVFKEELGNAQAIADLEAIGDPQGTEGLDVRYVGYQWFVNRKKKYRTGEHTLLGINESLEFRIDDEQNS